MINDENKILDLVKVFGIDSKGNLVIIKSKNSKILKREESMTDWKFGRVTTPIYQSSSYKLQGNIDEIIILEEAGKSINEAMEEVLQENIEKAKNIKKAWTEEGAKL